MIKKDFEKIFGQLFDNIPLVSIMGCEFDGTVFYWNKTAENLFGYKQDEIVGKNFADVIVPEKLRNKFINCLRESALIKQTDQYSPPIEVELRHKKGNKVPISCYQIKVLREGNDPLLFCLSIDVSEKRNKESKYRRILENMMDVYFFTDNDGIIQFVSDSAAKFYGVNDASDLVGKKALDMYFYPEEREIFYHSLKSSGRVTDEVTLRSQDGKPIITEMTTQYVYDEEGNQIGVDGVLRDVTKRHKTELALRESEVMFRRLFENELDSITILDAQTLDFEDANQATLDLYGYAREEYLSLNARDVTAEPEKTIPSIMKNRDKKRWDRIPLRYHRKKDGTIFPVEISNGVVEINNVKKIIGVVRDITKVKKSEEALKRSEERFRSIFENASTGINITDLSGNYLDVNESFCNMVGYTKEELVEKNFRDITFQDDLKKDIELFDDLLDNKIKNYQL
ncbi:PAS domain S-box protein, partial [Patescibacteria group bacterium]|nr:PAS domain S-box protein [Patescibacteria group bacterium]